MKVAIVEDDLWGYHGYVSKEQWASKDKMVDVRIVGHSVYLEASIRRSKLNQMDAASKATDN